MQSPPTIDIAVFAMYLAVVVSLGIWFARSNRSAKDFMQRYLKRAGAAGDALRILGRATLEWGALGTGVALSMLGQKSLGDSRWKLSGIFDGDRD